MRLTHEIAQKLKIGDVFLGTIPKIEPSLTVVLLHALIQKESDATVKQSEPLLLSLSSLMAVSR